MFYLNYSSLLMLEYYFFLAFRLFFIWAGVLVFRSRHKHFLITLLRLEYIMLNIFIILVLNLGWERSESYMSLIFLVFAVSEGRVGLSLLVTIARNHGSDQIKTLNLV